MNSISVFIKDLSSRLYCHVHNYYKIGPIYLATHTAQLDNAYFGIISPNRYLDVQFYLLLKIVAHNLAIHNRISTVWENLLLHQENYFGMYFAKIVRLEKSYHVNCGHRKVFSTWNLEYFALIHRSRNVG